MTKKGFERKPDIDLESFRAWIPTEDEKEDFGKEQKGDITVKYKDQEYILTGFTLAKVEVKGELKPIFAYKFKHHNKGILYYAFTEGIPKGEIEKQGDIILKIKNMGKFMGYSVSDLRDSIKSVYNERQTLDNLQRLKDKEGGK